MPGGDGTGPTGMGARTGGGRGFCRGVNVPRSGGSGRALGFGSGGGRGRRNCFSAVGQSFQAGYGRSMIGADEATRLKEQAEKLSQQLEVIQKRIKEFESQENR